MFFVDVDVRNVGFLPFWRFLVGTPFSKETTYLQTPPSVEVFADYGRDLFIRECYSTLLGFITDDALAGYHNRRAFTILGDGSVGKSFFAAYLMWYAAAKGINVIHEPPGLYNLRYFFYSNGEFYATLGTAMYYPTEEDGQNTWYIVDANQPNFIISSCVNRTILLTVPNEEVYKDWTIQMRARVRYMPAWSYEDLRSYCRSVKTASYEKLCSRYDFCGGDARKLLWSPTDDRYERESEHEISNMHLDSAIPVLWFSPSKRYDMPCFVIVPSDNYRSASFGFASRYIREKVVEQSYRTDRKRVLGIIRGTTTL